MTKTVLVPDEKGRFFARAVRCGQFLFISGMTGQWDLTTWELDEKSIGNIEYQTHRVFEWVQQVLAKCGLTLKDVVKTTTFVRNIKDVDTITGIKHQYWPDSDVANSAIAVSDFIGTADLEIEWIAMYPEGK